MNLDKDFLCDVICIVAITQDAIADAIDLGCVALDDLTCSRATSSASSGSRGLTVASFGQTQKAFVFADSDVVANIFAAFTPHTTARHTRYCARLVGTRGRRIIGRNSMSYWQGPVV
jgi:hypothetical protein